MEKNDGYYVGLAVDKDGNQFEVRFYGPFDEEMMPCKIEIISVSDKGDLIHEFFHPTIELSNGWTATINYNQIPVNIEVKPS